MDIPRIDLVKMTGMFQKFTGSKYSVRQEGDELIFPIDGVTFPYGSSIGFDLPVVKEEYIYNMWSMRDRYGRPSQWYPIFKWIDACTIHYPETQSGIPDIG